VEGKGGLPKLKGEIIGKERGVGQVPEHGLLAKDRFQGSSNYHKLNCSQRKKRVNCVREAERDTEVRREERQSS
jgi:hypothetical protein